MNLPGFTAEASLYQTSEYYRRAGAMAPPEGSLEPAVFVRGCMPHCLAKMGDDPYAFENCHCICFGHPGHTCWLQ
jgi:hypothetical protein